FLQIQPKLVTAGAVVLRVVLLGSEPEEVERMPGTALEEGCTRQANYLPLTIRFTLTAALVERVVNPGLLISSAVRVAAAMRWEEGWHNFREPAFSLLLPSITPSPSTARQRA